MIPAVTEHSDELKRICLRYSVQRLDVLEGPPVRIHWKGPGGSGARPTDGVPRAGRA